MCNKLCESNLSLRNVVKKVLIISYYWPPSGGSGVQRWLNFVKYLRVFGWEPVVYTVSNGEYPYLDPGLEQLIPKGIEVIRTPIWEPYQIFRSISRRKQNIDPTILGQTGKPTITNRIGLWVRANCFIPDPRIFWVRPSIQYLKTYLKNHPVDLVVSTGPPHSVHLIAHRLKQDLKLHWLADFRDPWTQLFFYKSMPLNRFSKWWHERLERKVLQSADEVITVSHHCKLGLEEKVSRKVKVITNGFEPFAKPQAIPKNDRLTMLYTGVLTADRNPVLLWPTLQQYLQKHPLVKEKFELLFIGNVDESILVSAKQAGLQHVRKMPPMAHAELQEYLCAATSLLLIGVPDEKGVVTGKFFEYLFVEKPILCVSPQGSDLEILLEETKSGYHADFHDQSSMEKAIEALFNCMVNGFEPNRKAIDQYSRKNLTRQLAQIMDSMFR